jgi:hypothetical protein
MFNSLKYAKQLEEAGLSRAQAEAQIQILVEVMDSNLVTKQDLKDTTLLLRQEMVGFRAELKQEIAELCTELKQDIQNLEHKVIQSEQRMTIKLGTIVSIAIGVAVALAKIVT